jgi:MFS family permease
MIESRRQALIGPALVLATLVTSIISSLGAPLIPTVARHYHESLSSAQWSLTVTLLVGAASSPVLGRLGDGPRRRLTMVGGLAVSTAGAVVAALAGSLEVLVVGRGLQGFGLGLVPLAMATARDELPRAKVPPMIALLSVSAAAGVGAGYPLSGLIAEWWGLAGAFWFGAIVCGLALLAVAAFVPSSVGRGTANRLDWLGAGLLAAALVTALIGVAEGTDWGWGSPAIIGLLVAGVVLSAVWAGQQLRVENPLVQLRLLRHPSVLTGDACAVVLGVAMYMTLSGVTEFVQTPRSEGFGFSASAVVAGLVLIPLSVLMLSGSRILPTLVGRLGTRAVLTLGCLVVTLACAFFAVFHDALWQAFVMMAVLGAGLGITFAALPGLIVQSVPARETGSAMGFYQVARYVGFSMGSALTATILAAHVAGNGEPTVTGYTTVLWIATGVCAAAGAMAWFLPTRSAPLPAAERLPSDEVRLAEQTDGDDLVVGTLEV